MRPTPLVLLHGLATTKIIWSRTLPLLERSARVLTIDVPGFGDAPPAGPGFDLGDVADRIRQDISAAGVEAPYDLVGHSMGGALAVTLAARAPGSVSRLILCAPAGLRPISPALANLAAQAAEHGIAFRRLGRPLAELRWGRRLLLGPGTARAGDLPPHEVRAMLDASRGATRISAALAAVAVADLREELRGLQVPVGAIWGAHDRIVPTALRATITDVRPEAPVEIVERAGHIPMMEEPAAFIDALHAVLAALSPAGNTASAAPQ